ncbi:choline dehydrogenase-like flavoprotein [Sediminihabitans luteus]|uniref:Choline dehydrogenase-like flavoprotein n=1 Tax=Sediminihabitans luteus TaxID=1138585 RepID=A0A2M9CZW4_9CELL|nr:FAD-dependent oxidoreductase [Sediminihabitans luteus]PJJ77365.1 choline dehydrogenase-like flavoprotein [Sediminihabitans luteus]GII98258.1 GMC oxidoreductase [Sediminihabitans luteus]
MPETLTPARRATLAALVDTFVAAVPHDGDDPHGFWATAGSALGADVAVEQYLTTRLPAEQLAGIVELLDAFTLTGLKNQPQHVREATVGVVSRIAPEAGVGVAAVRQLAINLAYAITDEQGRSPLLTGMGFPGVPDVADRLGRTLTVHETTPGEVVECDVVVVGSGSGGGVAAAELARAGRRVVVLEAGSYWSESEFGVTELAAYQQLCLKGGVFPTADGMVNVVAGGVVGGGSTVNWSNSVPLPDRLRERWASEFGLTDVAEDSWLEHARAVMDRLKVNDKVAYQNGPHTKLAQGADRLGWSYQTAALNIDPDRYVQHAAGFSGFGDATGAKQGTMRTYLQDASDAGAVLVPRARAVEVLVEDGAAAGVAVEILDDAGQVAHTVTISAPTVVVAAGSIETPALLLRSGIGGPAVGAGLKLHPAGLVSGLYGDEDLAPYDGPAQAGIMDQFGGTSTGGSAFLVEGVQQFPGLYASVTPWTSAAEHKELTSRYRSRADWVFIIEDLGGGRISIDDDGRSVATYPFDHEGDRRTFRNAVAACVRMHAASGADTIWVGGQPGTPWHRGEDVEEFVARLEELPLGAGGLVAFSAHQMGSAPLGTDPATSVADVRGELHDVRGVWIADASGMPTCSSVNPMITVMTLARRTAHHVLAG